MKNTFKFFPQLCGLIVAAIGVVTIVGWLMGWRILCSIREDYIPMAPNTAISFIVLGISLYTLITERKGGLKLSRIGASVIFVLSLIQFTEISVNINLNVDRWIFQVPDEKLGLIPVGQMPLPTALNFLFASVTLILASFLKKRWSVDALTRILAGLTTFIGLAFSLGYIYGAPLLYGGTTIPMALNTAIAFFILGLGLVINNVGHEVMERKRAAEALKRAHELEVLNESRANIERAKKEWDSTFDAISDPIFIHDREFRVVRANRAYARMANMSFEEMIGKPYYEVFPRMDGPFKMCLKALELQQEEEEEVFLPYIDKIFKVRFYPIFDVNGKHLYSIHVFEDITEAKRSAERIKQESEINRAILSVAESLSTTFDREEIFKRIIKIFPSVLEADRFTLFFYDEELKAFIPVSVHGMPADLMPFFMGMKLTSEVPIIEKLQRGEVAVIEDVHESPLLPRDIVVTFGMRAFMAVPVMSRGKTIGIIGVSRIEVKKPFTDKERDIVKGIAQQMATALENSSLYRETLEKTVELSRRIETISVMHEIDRAILSTLDSEEILENAVMMIGRVIPCDRAAVSLVDKERGGFIYRAGFGPSRPKGTFIPFSDHGGRSVISTRRPEYIADLSQIERPCYTEEVLIKDGFLSHIRVPIVVRDEAIGVLTISSKKRSAFTFDNLSTLEKIASQIGVALENARLISDLKELFIGTIKSLSEAVDAKSPWTKGHSERVTGYAIEIGKEMGLDDKELEDLSIAGLLHDIGKIGIYDIILDKPGRLTDEEYEIVKKHPLRGAELLSPIKKLRHIISWIRHHHERFDGKGYPDGFRGEEIPLQARILAIADTFDAMVSDRPYRKKYSKEETIEEIKRNAGTQFCPKVVEVFLKCVEDRKA